VPLIYHVRFTVWFAVMLNVLVVPAGSLTGVGGAKLIIDGGGFSVNVAVTDCALLLMLKLQGEVVPTHPDNPPVTRLQPANIELLLALALRLPTSLFPTPLTVQVAVQVIEFAGFVVSVIFTVPVPVPAKVIVRDLAALATVLIAAMTINASSAIFTKSLILFVFCIPILVVLMAEFVHRIAVISSGGSPCQPNKYNHLEAHGIILVLYIDIYVF
jgi:hypothetical protein